MAKKAKKRTAKKPIKVLPYKMSSLVKIALADMRKAEALPHEFVIDMGTWLDVEESVCKLERSEVEISRHKVCVACAAGSVMAFTLGKRHTAKTDLSPTNFPKNQKQLNAINSLRTGDAAGAAIILDFIRWNETANAYFPVKKFKNWDYDKLHKKINMRIPEYDSDNPEPFHKVMKKFEAKLRKNGL